MARGDVSRRSLVLRCRPAWRRGSHCRNESGAERRMQEGLRRRVSRPRAIWRWLPANYPRRTSRRASDLGLDASSGTRRQKTRRPRRSVDRRQADTARRHSGTAVDGLRWTSSLTSCRRGRAGGYIIGVKPVRGRPRDGERTASEFRSCEQLFPRLARRQNYLAILTQMLEKERTDQ